MATTRVHVVICVHVCGCELPVDVCGNIPQDTRSCESLLRHVALMVGVPEACLQGATVKYGVDWTESKLCDDEAIHGICAGTRQTRSIYDEVFSVAPCLIIEDTTCMAHTAWVTHARTLAAHLRDEGTTMVRRGRVRVRVGWARASAEEDAVWSTHHRPVLATNSHESMMPGAARCGAPPPRSVDVVACGRRAWLGWWYDANRVCALVVRWWCAGVPPPSLPLLRGRAITLCSHRHTC